MLYQILATVGFVVVAFFIYVAMRPSDFRIDRSLSMSASPSRVFPFVDDLHLWEDWSPWAKRDPNMRTTYSGAPRGVGAVYEWNGNKEVGQGKTTIVRSERDKLVGIKLEFIRPFAGTNDVEFAFAPEGGGTRVTWSMTGKYAYMAKAFGVFCDLDAMIGNDFEKGLASLKALAENQAKS